MGTTEFELASIVRDLGLGGMFLGTFDKTFPGFINKHKVCCAIVNTGTREAGGVHWLAMAWYPPSRTFYLFDPFGFSDKKLLQVYNFQYEGLLRRSAITSSENRCVDLVKSTETVQGPFSAACGLFCCLFLYAFARHPTCPMDGNPVMDRVNGVPNHLLKDPSVQSTLRANQTALYIFLAQHSPFFRNRRKEIENKTSFDFMYR